MINWLTISWDRDQTLMVTANNIPNYNSFVSFLNNRCGVDIRKIPNFPQLLQNSSIAFNRWLQRGDKISEEDLKDEISIHLTGRMWPQRQESMQDFNQLMAPYRP